MTDKLQSAINNAYRALTQPNPPKPSPTALHAVNQTLQLLDEGALRVAEPDPNPDNPWIVHQWLKKAVLLSLALSPAQRIPSIGNDAYYWDKPPLKTEGWTQNSFKNAGFRMVPGAVVRRSAFISPSAVLMPCFVNLAARVGRGSMIDTWATVGSCAQIGDNVHISGGAGIGGVLEPLQAQPVVVEDDCFIGARCEVAEGVRVRQGSVLSMGVFIGASTPILRRDNGKVIRGVVPPYSVVVPGSMPPIPNKPSLYCAVIVKTVDAQTRKKVAVNELLRS